MPVRRKWNCGGSMLLCREEVGVNRKSVVCNFCSLRTDCINTAVAETAVLQGIREGEIVSWRSAFFSTNVTVADESMRQIPFAITF